MADTPKIKLMSNLNLNDNSFIIKDTTRITFPDNPIEGIECLVNGINYIYTILDGFLSWIPTSINRETKNFTIEPAEQNWVISHNWNTDISKLDIICYNSDNKVITGNIAQIDKNSFSVAFSSAVAGRITLFNSVGVGSGLTPEDRIKLDSVEAEATKNKTDGFLLSRSNHTGTIPISVVENLEQELANISTGGSGGLTPDELLRIEELESGIVKKADLDSDGKILTSQLPVIPTSLPDADSDGKLYGRMDGTWTEIVNTGGEVNLTDYYTKSETNSLVGTKQDTLVSGTSIKTINGQSVLGSGDIEITGGGVDDTDVVKAPLGVLPVLDGSNLTGIDGLPDQTGFAGKYLKTDGTIATWESASTWTGITNNEFIATAGQTVFTVTYTVGNLDVYQNGLLLSYTDYVATDGTSIILAVGATTGDLVSVKVYDTFSVGDAYTKAEVDANIDESITTAIVAIDLSSKQDTLVSGTSIKTINGQSVLGSGDIEITGGASLTNYYDKTKTETLLSNKVDKVTGKGLSTNDFTNTFKQALELKKVQDISTDSVTKKLVVNYTDATVANLNINDIVTDVKVSGATLDATTNVLTLTSTDGGVDVIVDLSDFVNSGELTSALSGKADKIHSHSTSDITGLDTTLSNLTTNLSNKQDNLVSGTSIKTINSSSILGSGNLDLLTATNPSIMGSITEGVYNLTGAEINPTNGTIQYKTVSANTTFTETLISGQSVLLRLINANSYTITFPTITWVGAVAPKLTTNCVIVLWKEQSTLYGAYVGSLV